MKTILKLEEASLFIVGLFLFAQLDFAWWWFLVLLLLPDIGMLGYVVNNRVGAFTYNLFHYRAVSVGLLVFGYLYEHQVLLLCGVVLFSHIALDRMLGYGLKYPDSFKNTHLGKIGN
jgi:Domain of unknown function (DUF4260)